MNSLDGSMLIKWLDTRISATIRFKSDCVAPENANETPLLSCPLLKGGWIDSHMACRSINLVVGGGRKPVKAGDRVAVRNATPKEG